MKLAFFVPSLSATQLSYTLIKNINDFYEHDRSAKLDLVVFYEHQVQPCLPTNFMTSNATDAFNYDGPMISTTLSTAHKALRFPRAKHLFYIYDLEWLELRSKQFEILSEIYTKPKSLLVRSVWHADLIKSIWNKNSEVVGNFDIRAIANASK